MGQDAISVNGDMREWGRTPSNCQVCASRSWRGSQCTQEIVWWGMDVPIKTRELSPSQIAQTVNAKITFHGIYEYWVVTLEFCLHQLCIARLKITGNSMGAGKDDQTFRA